MAPIHRPLPVHSRSLLCALALALIDLPALLSGDAGTARADEPVSPCSRCNLLVGIGATYRFFAWMDSAVVPVTLELDESRWEVGAFRMTSAQRYLDHAHATDPYWAFTAMRRWQVVHRAPWRLYLGFGANYRTETDYLETTRWNFAYLVAARFDLGSRDRLLEFGIRHWSNAWIRPPNRGQDLITLSYGF